MNTKYIISGFLTALLAVPTTIIAYETYGFSYQPTDPDQYTTVASVNARISELDEMMAVLEAEKQDLVAARESLQNKDDAQQFINMILEQIASQQGELENTPEESEQRDELQRQINDLLNQVADLQAGLSNPQPPTVCPYTWTRNLSAGDRGMDVLALEQFLNADPDTRIQYSNGTADTETDQYHAGIAAAVSKFQVKYRADVLSPQGLMNPTGNFDSQTRAKANSLCVAPPIDDEEDLKEELPSCSITSDKSSYVYGEPIEITWSSEHAEEAYFETWHGGKDNIAVPSSSQNPNGSIMLTANVLGNPYVELQVESEDGVQASCRTRFAVEYAEKEEISAVYDTDGDGWVYGTDDNNYYNGDAEENILVGSAGDDYIDGGDDWDEVNYVESDACFTNFSISSLGNGTYEVKSARYGVDTLVNIEAVYFVGCGGHWERLDEKE